jgi:hypothetical protein
MKTGAEGADGSYAGGGRLAAYAYMQTKNPAFAKPAWGQILGGGTGNGTGYGLRGSYTPVKVEGPEALNPIVEIPGITTNSVAQSALHAIEVLAMCGDRIP